MKRARPTLRDEGFTLLELLIVLAILGLIVMIATPQLMKVLGGAKQDAARLQIEAVGQSLDLYRLDVGSYPTTEQGLSALWKKPEGVVGWSGPYVKSEEQLNDPWGRRLLYKAPGESAAYALGSLGEDNAIGGEDEAADIGLMK